MSSNADKKPVHRREPVILFGVGDYTFAISAASVDEIRNTNGLQPISVTGDVLVPKVRFRLVRDGRKYYVVDANLYFRLLPERATRILVLRNSNVAVLVSHIDRMTEIGNVLTLPRAFSGNEREWYRGLTVLDAGGETPTVIPVVRAESFLTKAEFQSFQKSETQ